MRINTFKSSLFRSEMLSDAHCDNVLCIPEGCLSGGGNSMYPGYQGHMGQPPPPGMHMSYDGPSGVGQRLGGMGMHRPPSANQDTINLQDPFSDAAAPPGGMYGPQYGRGGGYDHRGPPGADGGVKGGTAGTARCRPGIPQGAQPPGGQGYQEFGRDGGPHRYDGYSGGGYHGQGHGGPMGPPPCGWRVVFSQGSMMSPNGESTTNYGRNSTELFKVVYLANYLTNITTTH